MKSLSEKEMRSLVGLLDDEDDASLGLVCDQILKIGDPILPFLDDMRAHCASSLVGRVDSLTAELRYRNLKKDFAAFASAPDPDLEKGTWLFCRFGYPGVRPAVYSDWLDRVAAAIRKDLPAEPDPYTVMQHLNNHLFQELGFSGNEQRYYDPDNTYLNRVIETRRGIPVTLSVLYLLLGRRLNLPIHGVGTPGHFLVGFREPNQTCFYIDPYHKGRLLAAQDVRRMLVRSGYEFRLEFLEKASPREIVARMMRNLISIYQKSGSAERAEMLSGLIEAVLTGKQRDVQPPPEGD
jgi:regulator of sirC expression with transglutaminase-like and TPR domain